VRTAAAGAAEVPQPPLLLLLLPLAAGLASSAVAPFCCCAASWLRVAQVRRARAGVSSSKKEWMHPGSYSCQDGKW
jgi:hypothetical protein